MKPKHPNVPIPPNLRGRPRTANGYVKPWFVRGDDFRVVDPDNAIESIVEGTCFLCGKPNKKGPWAFVGGPKCHALNTFSEPPMHPQCARYGLKVCPFILYPKAKRRQAGLTPEEAAMSDLQDPDNPGEWWLHVVTNYAYHTVQGNPILSHTKRDLRSATRWVGGTIQPQED